MHLTHSSLEFDVVDVPRLERMLKEALQFEEQAEQAGKLRSLPPARFVIVASRRATFARRTVEVLSRRLTSSLSSSSCCCSKGMS